MIGVIHKPYHGVECRKAGRSAAFAILVALAAVLPSRAQTNWVSGTAYGTNDLSTAPLIASVEDGAGSLQILFPGTTDLVLSNSVEGTIMVSNNFTGLAIDATGGEITGSDTAVLYVRGGTGLTISNGTFTGMAEEAPVTGPPIPGGSSGFDILAAAGGILEDTTNAMISGSVFTGTTFTPNADTSYGTDALRLLGSTGTTIVDGTLTGGDGGDAASGTSTGGAALYVEDSSVQVSGGMYQGGSAGPAAIQAGGAAVFATNSTIEINGNAALTGGADAPALYARNSDLIVSDGTFLGGTYDTTNHYFGLVSQADAAHTNHLSLTGGTFNTIDFTGDGLQLLAAGGTLQVDGYVVLDGATLRVDNASSTAFQKLLLRSGSIGFLNNYTLASGGIVDFIIVTNSLVTLTADTAALETNSTLRVDASNAGFSTGTNDVVLLATANGLSIIDAGGSTNTATDANVAENVQLEAITVGRTHLSDVLVDGGSNLVFRFSTQQLKDYLNATGSYGEFIDELEMLMPDEMSTVIDLIDDAALTDQALERTYYSMFNNLQIALQGMRGSLGQSLSRNAEFRDQLKLLPPGAKGPERNNQLRGWARYFGEYITHDGQGINPDYDAVLHGGVAGIDTSIGNLMIGFSGGSSHYGITHDDDAESDTVAYLGNLYGTYGMENGYLEADLAYGKNQVNTRTADPFRLDGSFDATVASAYLGGGYNLIDTDGGTVFTPEASLQYSMYDQDGYTETGTAAVPRVIDAFDADSLLSTLGMNVSMLNSEVLDTFGFKADLRTHWMHEFMADPSDMTFRLQGGSNVYRLAYPGLDEDLFRIGVGCSFFNTMKDKPQNVLLRLDFDELFGDGFNAHYVSAKLVYAF